MKAAACENMKKYQRLENNIAESWRITKKPMAAINVLIISLAYAEKRKWRRLWRSAGWRLA
jgi:hypothetical protein